MKYLNMHGQSWIIHKDSVREVGCIHTCQGLELSYAGIIIGPDLVVRNGVAITDPLKRASSDKSLHGYKNLYKVDPENAKNTAEYDYEKHIQNFATRDMRGSFVFSTDPETQEYLIHRFNGNEKKIPIDMEDRGVIIY